MKGCQVKTNTILTTETRRHRVLGVVVETVDYYSVLMSNLPCKTVEGLNDITGKIVDASFQVHSQLGAGLIESVYEKCLIWELQQKGLRIESQYKIPIFYKNQDLESDLKIDLLVIGWGHGLLIPVTLPHHRTCGLPHPAVELLLTCVISDCFFHSKKKI